MERIPVGISSCLCGEPVRFDGGHRYEPLVNKLLTGLFEFRPCCPEVAIGLGVPREPIQLVLTDQGIRVRGVHNPDADVTLKLAAYGNRIAREFEDICGYIFKTRSPSCGIRDATIWTEQGEQYGSGGTGIFAATLIRARPGLPVTDENQLQDPMLREEFIASVFTLYRNSP